MGKFITFEGGEGSGKTTQIKLAADWLRERGIPVLATAEPGGTPLGRKIREILLNRGSCAIGAEAELLLFAAARAQHVRETILPALEAGQWVLCDRFSDATLAYQGFGRGLDVAFIRTLNDFSALFAQAGSDAAVRSPRGGRSGAGGKTGGRRPARGGGGPFRAGGEDFSREDPGRVSEPRSGGTGTLPDHRRRGGCRVGPARGLPSPVGPAVKSFSSRK